LNASGLGVPIFRYYKWLKGLIIALLFLNTQLFAAPFSGAGSGTVGDPYQIVTPAHLNEVRNSMTSHYKLMNDIDLTAYLASGGDGYTAWGTSGWMPLGHSGTGTTVSAVFSGTFDGNFKTISGLFINRLTQGYIGLFSKITGTIKNLKIDIGGDISGTQNVGVLSGDSSGTIDNCHSSSTSGAVKASNQMSGGLIGLNTAPGRVDNSSSQVEIISTNSEVGGLVGRNNAIITKSFATGNITGTYSLGGLAGEHYGTAPEILDSYSTGNVTSSSNEYYIGGLVGNAVKPMIRCYSVGAVTTSSTYKGAFSGNATGAITDSFFNSDTSIITTNPNMTGLTSSTTANMQNQASSIYTGWDFSTVWEWTAGSGVYPTLIPVVGWAIIPTLSTDTHLIYKHGSSWNVSDNGRYIATNVANISTIQVEDVESNISKPTGATIKVFSSSNVEKTTGSLASGDYVRVTAEDGTTTRDYLLFGIRPQIAAGSVHTLILDENGKVYSFGGNTMGQLGLGHKTSPIQKPTQITIPQNKKIIAIASGSSHSLLLDTEGRVYSFGNGSYGKLGQNGTSDITSPTLISEPNNIIAISAGGNHSLLLGKDGKVYSFGLGDYGQLGDNSTSVHNKLIPYYITQTGENNITAIEAGSSHSLLLDKNGTVYSFGLNSSRQLGLGTTSNNGLPTQVTVPNTITAILSAQYSSTSFIMGKDGKIYSFGSGSSGSAGHGATAVINTPTQMVALGGENITTLATGGSHTFAIGTDGKLYGFGSGNYGRLGDNNTTTTAHEIYTPYYLSETGEHNITAIAAGNNHTIIVDKEGKFYGFGAGSSYQTGLCTNSNIGIPTELGTGSCLFINTYTVTFNSNGGSSVTSQTVNQDMNATSPTVPTKAGYTFAGWYSDSGLTSSFSFATPIVADTTLYAKWNLFLSEDTHLSYKHNSNWSINNNGGYIAINGNLTTIPVSAVDGNISKPTGGATIQIFDSSNVEKTTGNLASGDYVKVTSGDGTATRIYKLFGIKPQISAGENHTLILDADGKVYSFGSNEYGQLGRTTTETIDSMPTQIDIAGENNITAIVATKNQSFLLDKDGKVYSFGYSEYGQLGHGDTQNKLVPTQIAGISNIVSISAGTFHTLLLGKDGKVYSFGNGGYGKLGHGNETSFSVPTQIMVAGENNITAITAGASHSLLLGKDGKVYSFGYSGSGELGHGNEDTQLSPKQIMAVGENNITAMSASGSNSLLLGKDGKVYSFGNSGDGKLGLGDGVSNTNIPTQVVVAGDNNITAIAQGESHTLILDKNGKVYGFGNNFEGRLGLGSLDTTSKSLPTQITAIADKISQL
jgi:uncharacterized repeat protein (TIGR02543 family)